MYRKIGLAAVLGFCISAVTAGCSSAPGSDGSHADTAKKETTEKIVLVGGITQAKDTPLTDTLEKFGELVDEKTGGEIVIDIKTDSALGGEREMAEAMQLGTVDFGLVSSAPLSNFASDIGVVDLPFIFNDRKHAWSVLNGDIGDELFAELPAQGLIGLSWVDNGFRSVFTKDREIRTPEDMKNLKIRVMESDVYIQTFTALGANPVPMSSSEVYTALQQGTIDAAENSVISYNTLKYYEVAPVFSETLHTYSVMPLVMSKGTWDKLSENQQKAVKEAAVEAAKWHIDNGEADDEKYMNEAREQNKGIKIVEINDLTPFREACKSVYDTFSKNYRDGLIDDILNHQ